MSISTTVTWYVARNPLGQYSCGTQWVDDLADARLYRSIGPAKAAATRWAKKHPGQAPQVLEWRLDIGSATILDVGAHTKRSLTRIERDRQQRDRAEAERDWHDLVTQERRLTEKRQLLAGRLGL